VCGSLDRERLVFLYLRHRTDIFAKPHALLHVAPEPRIASALQAAPSVAYVSIDLQSPRVMARADVSNLAFPDNSFDAILCNHVLEHVTDDGRAMREIHRTLKPGGWAVLQVPISRLLPQTYEDASKATASEREAAFGQHDHVRIYSTDYADRLNQAGFNVDVFRWIEDSEQFGGPGNSFGLNSEEAIYIAHKSPEA
jgi:predicted SAM-dependent methyltransferase